MGARRTTLSIAAATIAFAFPGLSASAAESPDVVADDAFNSGDTYVNFVGVFESWRARARAEGFLVVEEALLSQAALSGKVEEAADLAYFYFAMGLIPEASAVIRTIDEGERTTALSFLEGAAAIRMGRWCEAVALLSRPPLNDHPDAVSWRGIAYVQLGAFDAAAADLLQNAKTAVPFEKHATQYYLAQAQAALAIGHIDPARTALENVRNRVETQRQRDRRRLLEARILLARGETATAVSLLNTLARAGEAPISLHAQIDLLRHKQRSGALSKPAALDQVKKISMRWSGGAVERELLETEASLLDMSGDVIGAVAAQRKLLRRFPDSDAARAAAGAIRTALASILSDETLPPRDAARAFYTNIDLAPPGAEGDALIRDAADILAGLDLLPEAAELLRHQVFERLRGVERSKVAVDLAELYLAKGDPAAAIEVIENTRRSRLPDALIARRAYLEADAHFRRDDGDRALAILHERRDFPALALRGRILSAHGEHAEAGAAFAAAAATGDGDLSAEQADAAILAASAYAQLGDEKALRALSDDLADRMGEGPAKDLFDAIAADDLPGAPDDFQDRYAAFFSG